MQPINVFLPVQFSGGGYRPSAQNSPETPRDADSGGKRVHLDVCMRFGNSSETPSEEMCLRIGGTFVCTALVRNHSIFTQKRASYLGLPKDVRLSGVDGREGHWSGTLRTCSCLLCSHCKSGLVDFWEAVCSI